MTENDLARSIVDAPDKVHVALGPGLLESVYALALGWELEQCGVSVARQCEIPVIYQRIRMEAGFRADLIVDSKVIVEIKSVETVAPYTKSNC